MYSTDLVSTVATATTSGQQHALSLNDEFRLHITSNVVQTFNLKYNEEKKFYKINWFFL